MVNNPINAFFVFPAKHWLTFVVPLLSTYIASFAGELVRKMSFFKEMLAYIQGPLDPTKFVIGCILLTILIFAFYYCCCKSDELNGPDEDVNAIRSSNAVLLNSINEQNLTSTTKDTVIPSFIELRNYECMTNLFKTLTKHYSRAQSQPNHRTRAVEYRNVETV